MSSCQLCGEETDSTKKVKIEGAVLKVCNSCSEMGEEVKKGGSRKKKSGGSSSPRTREVLVDGYGSKIKNARESEGISIGELADELNEKSSLISKIEKEDLKPDNSLAGKLSDRLGVELYTNPEVSSYDTGRSTDDREATLEDVADVKE